MTLILDRLAKCSVDPVALIQKQLFQLPADSVHFVLDRSKALQLHVVNDRSAPVRRFYAVKQELVEDLGDMVRQYCFIPFRSELGAVGLMQVNLQSKDNFSVAKRQAFEADARTYSVTRLPGTYEFIESSDVDITPVTDDEYENALNLIFSESIIE